MFSKLKDLLGGSTPANAPEPKPREEDESESPANTLSDNDKLRFAEMIEYLEEPEQIFMDDAGEEHTVHVLAFGRNFVEECDDDAEDEEGYVLVTSGMSDKPMPRTNENTDNADNVEEDEEDSPRKELIWYVRDLNPEYIHYLRWLAKLPNFDQFFLTSGSRVPMPEPPLTFCDKRVFFFLQPTIRTDRQLLDDIVISGAEIQTLCVHMITATEHALAKTNDGLNQFLDLLDENEYPLIFDPARPSYV
jgi:Suppressor of fused protein (SUFU)